MIPIEQYSKYYNKQFSELGSHMFSKESHFDHAQRLVSMIQNRNGLVLDAACGDGTILKLLIDSGFDAVGCDISSVASKLCYNNCGGACTPVIVSNVLQLPFKSDTFNVVILSEVIEHICDIDLLLMFSELRRVSKSGAQFIVSSCNKKIIHVTGDGLNNYFQLNYSPSHVHERTESELRHELADHVVVESSFVGGVPLKYTAIFYVMIPDPKLYFGCRIYKTIKE